MYLFEHITNWYAQGMIVGISLGIVTAIVGGLKSIATRLLFSKNPMTRYITFYSSVVASLFFTVLVTYFVIGEWSLELIEKPLCITMLFALAHSFFVVRKIRISEQTFITKSSHLISFQITDLNKSLKDQTAKIKSSWASKGFSLPPGMMYAEIKEEYIAAMSVQVKTIWDIFASELNANQYVIPVKFLSEFNNKMTDRYLSGLENGLKYELSQIKIEATREALMQEFCMKKDMIAKKYDPKIYLNNSVFAFTS